MLAIIGFRDMEHPRRGHAVVTAQMEQHPSARAPFVKPPGGREQNL